MYLVILVEEKSMREALICIMKKLEIPESHFKIIPHSGVSDLKKSLPRKLRAWRKPQTEFLVLRDNDNGDCQTRKGELEKICQNAGKQDVSTIRIVCQELESWFLGDLSAVENSGLTSKNLAQNQQKKKFREPDNIDKPSIELKRIIPEYQKVMGAKMISPHLSINNNKSHSFGVVIRSLQEFSQKLPDNQ